MKPLRLGKFELYWRSSKFFKYAGLYLRISDKRYRIFKVGEE